MAATSFDMILVKSASNEGMIVLERICRKAMMNKQVNSVVESTSERPVDATSCENVVRKQEDR